MVDSTRNKRLPALLCAAAMGLTATFAAADDTTFEMTSYIGPPGGSALLDADYAAAVDAASRRVHSADPLEALVANTNLCIAYTVLGEFDEARVPCDEAVGLARRADNHGRGVRRNNEETAKALSNRGVLRALSGARTEAATDFRAAAKLGSGLPAPQRNLALLESTPDDRFAMVPVSDD